MAMLLLCIISFYACSDDNTPQSDENDHDEIEIIDSESLPAGWKLDSTETFSYLEYKGTDSTLPWFDETAEFNDNYFVYESIVDGNRLYGYMDTEFNKLSDPISSMPGIFMYDLAYARIDNRSAVIDTTFNEVETYFNNFVRMGNSLVKVNWYKEPVENPYYIENLDFDKYPVPVESKTGLWGYMTFNAVYSSNPEGYSGFVIEPIFENAGGFFEGRAAVKLGDKWGYIDESGKIVIDCIYDRAVSFKEGIARVFLNDYLDGEVEVHDRWGIIDSEGSRLTYFSFTSIDEFDQGVAEVVFAGAHYSDPNIQNINQRTSQGYLKTDGTVIPDTVSNDSPLRKFEEDKLIIKGMTTYLYINREGQRAVPGDYYSASDFSDGLAAVRLSENSMRWGYIDEAGVPVISESYTLANPFTKGFAYVRVNREQNGFLMDRNENLYLGELKLSGITKFNNNGYALGYSESTEMVTRTNLETGLSYQEKVTQTRYYMIRIN